MKSKREGPPDAERFVPQAGDLGELARAVQSCRGCDLYRDATQAVFGKGPAHARLILLGEQPGDVEDRRGEPFVGPAGALLRRALRDARIDESDTYLTNAVKHFHWRSDPRGGKRRIHQRPGTGHVVACRPWWQAEVRLVRPAVVVTLGATAGEALFGASFRVGETRGRVLRWTPPHDETTAATAVGPDRAELRVVPTVHPSAVLRAPDRDESFAAFVDDLRRASDMLARSGGAAAHGGGS